MTLVLVGSSLAATSASAAPSVTPTCTPAPADCKGWYRSDVKVEWTVLPSDAVKAPGTCVDQTLTADTPRVSLFCTADDGSSATTVEVRISIDKTPPTVLGGSPDRSADFDGWYTDPVVVKFSGEDLTSGVATCTETTYRTPDSVAANVQGTCVDRAGNVSAPLGYGLKYDATAPTDLVAEPNYAANAFGWFNRPVAFTIRGTDPTSGIAACPGTFYDGPDDASAQVTGVCRDRAGNFSSREFSIKYDTTPPDVTDVERRDPDRQGWYVSPVQFNATGADALSQLDSCPPVTYSGPDSATATVVVWCHDRAGNSTSSSIPLKYDANAPPLTNVVAAGGNRSVALSWQTSSDAVSIAILRTPGLDGESATGVYNGTGMSFVDNRVENGVRYEYEFSVSDAAGHITRQTVVGLPVAPQPNAPPRAPASPSLPVVSPTPSSILPAPGSVLRAGDRPLFQWPRSRRATYYNVQLFRGGRKILSKWPTRARYQLKTPWIFRGRRERLGPGRYRWMVWPGIGKRSKADFGRRIVNSAFTVKSAGSL